MKKINKGIKSIDGKVNVKLVWNNNVDSVSLNHNICLVALDRVIRKLDRSGFAEAYCQYWSDYKAADYIEECDCQPNDYAKYKWLTHRPIFKHAILQVRSKNLMDRNSFLCVTDIN